MKINFDNLTKIFMTGENFSLTEEDYQNKTGHNLPKDNRYLLSKSALAKCAKEYGYSMSVKERVVELFKE